MGPLPLQQIPGDIRFDVTGVQKALEGSSDQPPLHSGRLFNSPAERFKRCIAASIDPYGDRECTDFFDQILGQHNLWARIPAMTGTLSVRFRKGTPILRELAFDVRHERRGERKVITSGRLHAGGEVFSEAEGTFVVPKSASWDGR